MKVGGGIAARPVYIVLTSSAVVVAAWRVLKWRARKRARKTVERIRDSIVPNGGPLIRVEDPTVTLQIMTSALKRASKWMSLSEDDAKPMVGQVGGLALHKKPLLTLKPDYVLKPLLTDHRGIREIAFYEAIRRISTTKKSPSSSPSTSSASKAKTLSFSTPKNLTQTYSNFLCGKLTNGNTELAKDKNRLVTLANYLGDVFDTFAMALAILFQDAVVIESEQELRKAWRSLKKEVDVLHKLAKFTAPYYGVVGQKSAIISEKSPFGVTDNAHLLLQDLTVNFSKPCVMDLKMGCQSYEPDATPEKRKREFGKYPQQIEFGFRIVGMRIYDPTHADADSKGFRVFGKEYGRDLKSYDEILQAFRIYFSSGVDGFTFEDELNASIRGDHFSYSAATEKSDESKENGESNTNHNGSSSPTSASPIVAATDALTTHSNVRTRSVSNLMVQLRPLRRWFEENKSLKLYASSLLIVYEGDNNIKTCSSCDLTLIKMIDFGRVRREAGGDTGYLAGLTSLGKIFSDLMKEEEERAQQSQQPSVEVSLN